MPPSPQLASPPNVRIIGGLAPFASRYDLLLCDIWGVVHDGLRAFPLAVDALGRFRRGGGRVVLVTNAPRPSAAVALQLERLQVPVDAYDAIRTSGDLTREIIARHGERPFHHIGPERDRGLFEGVPGRSSPLEEADYVVCTGLNDDERETIEDYRDTLRLMAERGLRMICANPDLTVERGDRVVLCAGALAAAYEEIGGPTLTAGKPYRPIYDSALEEGARLLGRIPAEARVLALGDAVRTDIAGGHGAGLDTLLIARGLHSAELGLSEDELDPAHVAEWAARQAVRPTYIMRELRWGT